MIEKIYSKIEPNKLLHLINRYEDIIDRINLCPNTEFLQLATLNMKKGTTFKPHKHIYKNGPNSIIAQESWVVINGSVKVYMYDIDDTIIHTPILHKGDCSITFYGGHTYEILEDNTVVYEYKTGPYYGLQNDKEFI